MGNLVPKTSPALTSKASSINPNTRRLATTRFIITSNRRPGCQTWPLDAAAAVLYMIGPPPNFKFAVLWRDELTGYEPGLRPAQFIDSSRGGGDFSAPAIGFGQTHRQRTPTFRSLCR